MMVAVWEASCNEHTANHDAHADYVSRNRYDEPAKLLTRETYLQNLADPTLLEIPPKTHNSKRSPDLLNRRL